MVGLFSERQENRITLMREYDARVSHLYHRAGSVMFGFGHDGHTNAQTEGMKSFIQKPGAYGAI